SERSPRSRLPAKISPRYGVCWTKSKRGGRKNDHATQPAVDRASGLDASAFSVARNSVVSPLRARPGFGRQPHFGARPLHNCLRFAIGDDRGACSYLLVAWKFRTGGADRGPCRLGRPAACLWGWVPAGQRSLATGDAGDCHGVVRWRRRVFAPTAYGIHLRRGSPAFASCAGAYRMAANLRPADRTHARVATGAVAGDGSSGFSRGHRLASPG